MMMRREDRDLLQIWAQEGRALRAPFVVRSLVCDMVDPFIASYGGRFPGVGSTTKLCCGLAWCVDSLPAAAGPPTEEQGQHSVWTLREQQRAGCWLL